MADDEKAGDGKSEKASSSTGAVLGVLLASVIAAGGGVYLGWSQFGKQEPAKHAAKDAHGKAGKDEKYTDGSRVRDLQPITTNLAGTPPAWIRLEASVLLNPENAAEPQSAEEVELLRVVNEDVVAFLRTVTLTQLQGPSGFQSLREDLDERVRIRSEGKIKELIVQSMILE
ncbi:MAG: flagellar basal body-associated FliL family protein [Hyphomicrobiaceae bacterium]|nr:flagellar basal body-associated FliL family protein [Hyphomicrobiaceae bacterium]